MMGTLSINRWLLKLTTLGFLLVFVLTDDAAKCSPGWTKFGHYCYKMNKTRVNHTEAEEACVSEGSHLASVHSTEEQTFVVEQLRKAVGNRIVSSWLGGANCSRTSQECEWLDGTHWNYSNWRRGQPSENKENSLGLHKKNHPRNIWNFEWDDIDPSKEFRYICKKLIGKWTEWNNSGSCSVYCGSGWKKQQRRCVDHQNKTLDSSKCDPAQKERTVECYTDKCGDSIKTTSSSTKDNNIEAYGAHHVLDESQGWAITGKQKFPWIELELAKEQTISEIKIHIKPDPNKKYELRVGNESAIGSSGMIEINQVCEPSSFKILSKEETITFKCGRKMKGKFITLQQIEEGETNLEVKYFIVDLPEKINYLLIIGIIVSIIIIFVLSAKYCTQKKEVEKYQQIQKNFKKELLAGDGCDPDTDQIENMPYSRKYEINIDQFTIEKVIGDGQFGKVSLGKAKDIYGAGEIKVAIKQVKSSVDADQLQIIVGELKIMSNLGSHPNLVNFVGACTSDMTNNKIYILLEYCDSGDLKKVLLENRGSFLVNIGQGDGYVDPRFNPKLLLNWSFQTAKGMEYLESLKIMHGDLAARNILIDKNFNAKISDFGMSKQLEGYQAYMKQERRMIPWAWMGLEYLQTGEFNIKSDVWSFGVVLWEIYSLGSKPYGNEPYADVKNKLVDGHRLELPKHMSSLDTGGHIYSEVMMPCWEANPENRPKFKDLVGRLEAMMEPGELDKYNKFVENFNKMQEKRTFTTFPKGDESHKYIIDNSLAKKNEDQDELESNGYVFHASVDHNDDNSSEYVVFKNNGENKGSNVLDSVEYINV